ncbi:MAG: DUF4290 domain-containing protein [Saprospiraceae bacterium]|nr:DUF4290 domain-containing protein [Saprospiraceae bacterium]MCB9321621.1 DUF4290 domain-containing protein [Lewinellaceae bacterium]
MQYNSTKTHLIYPEYGRHIQEMIHYARTIENPKERQAYAEEIIRLMHFIDSQDKSNFDNEDKLWKHLFTIAEFDIDVMPPSGVKPTREELEKAPPRVEYPQKDPNYRHYGLNVERLLEKAVAMEDDDKREVFVNIIGSYMKMAYKNWNKEHYVNDEIIKNDIALISKGKLIMDEETSLDYLSTAPRINYKKAKKKMPNNNKGKSGSNKYRKR